jgi:hypothetical protein
MFLKLMNMKRTSLQKIGNRHFKQSNNTNSRISVGTDSNNDLQLRSNNSYLHDNVD